MCQSHPGAIREMYLPKHFPLVFVLRVGRFDERALLCILIGGCNTQPQNGIILADNR
jgi:hypothetical protein